VYKVYAIQNPKGRFYIGISEDVRKRLLQHNDGESRWTNGKGPWIIRWTSEAMSLSEARKLENFLKKQKGGNGFYQYTGIERFSS
jgi:putative endonuclease